MLPRFCDKPPSEVEPGLPPPTTLATRYVFFLPLRLKTRINVNAPILTGVPQHLYLSFIFVNLFKDAVSFYYYGKVRMHFILQRLLLRSPRGGALEPLVQKLALVFIFCT